MNNGQRSRDDYMQQARAELAFAKAMGWKDWTHGEESEEGMVRGYRVQWSPHPDAPLVVHDADDDDARYVLVTGRLPTFEVHDWTTVGEAKRLGKRIGQG